MTRRVQHATMTWAKTGKTTDLPSDLPGAGSGPGAARRLGGLLSGAAGTLLDFIGGTRGEPRNEPMIFRKARDHASAPADHVADVRAQLGDGRPLETNVRMHMSRVFGEEFSRVRVHTDARAATLASELQARSFTIGDDIAFGADEYCPGTLIGDALIAHELAHVVQQRGARPTTAPDPSPDRALEHDADVSAANAVGAVWGRPTGAGGYGGRQGVPAAKQSVQAHHRAV